MLKLSTKFMTRLPASQLVGPAAYLSRWISISFLRQTLFAAAVVVHAHAQPTPPVLFEAPARITDTGVFANAETLQPAALYKRYEVTSELWSDCAEKKRWIYVPNGHSVQFRQRGAWTFPEGTVIVKQFNIARSSTDPASSATPVKLETRILWFRGGHWIAAGYRWNDGGTEAYRVDSPQTVTFQVAVGSNESSACGPRTQTWSFPSPQQCTECHTRPAANYPLGIMTHYLNRNIEVVDSLGVRSNVNQLQNWADSQILSLPAGTNVSALDAMVNPHDETLPLLARAKSYLDANCAHCHGRGRAPGGLHLGFWLPPLAQQTHYIPPSDGNLGIADAFRIKPFEPEKSLVYVRMLRRDDKGMPKIGSHLVHPEGAELIRLWIEAGAN